MATGTPYLALTSYGNVAASDPDMCQWMVSMLVIRARMDSPSYKHLPSLPIEMWVLIWSFLPRLFWCFEFAFRNALHADRDREYLLPYMNRSLFPKTLRGFQERFVQLALQIYSLERVRDRRVREPLDPHPSIKVSLVCCTMRCLKGEREDTTPLFVSMFHAPDGQALTATNPWGEETVVQDYSPGKPYREAATIFLNVLMNMDRLVKNHCRKEDPGDGEQCRTVIYRLWPSNQNQLDISFYVNYENVTNDIDKRFEEKIQQELDSGDIELFQ